MILELYQNASDPRRVDKSVYLTLLKTVQNIKPFDSVGVLNAKFLLNYVERRTELQKGTTLHGKDAAYALYDIKKLLQRTKLQILLWLGQLNLTKRTITQ